MTLDLEKSMIQQLELEMRHSMDQTIIDELWEWPPSTYYIHKSWLDRGGRKMHRISVSGHIMEWLEKEQSQYGIPNPEWWYYQHWVNISDRLLVMLMLKWGKNELSGD
jgi:hypothetical protein